MEQANSQRQDMTAGPIWQKLLLFFFPTWFGAVFQQLYNTADAVIVGRFVGTGALAAVGVGGTLVMFIGGVVAGIASGATVVVAQRTGAGRPQEVRRAVGAAALASLLLGAVLSAAGILAVPAVLRAMDTPAAVFAESVLYMRVYLAGMVPMLFYNVGTGILRAVGDSRRPLYFLAAASVLNILLDLLFVAALGLGVLGAALATLLSQTASALLVLRRLAGPQAEGEPYRLQRQGLRLDPPALAAMARIGVPAAVQAMLYDISNILVQVYINGFGTTAMAAWAVFGKLDSLFWMTVQSLGLAVTTFAGQNFGARRYDRMRSGVRQACGIGLGFAACIVALMLGLGRPLYGCFTADAEVVELGLAISRFVMPWYISFVGIEVLSATMRGAGDTLVPTLITVFGVCAVRVAWLFWAAPAYGSIQAGLACFPVSWCITLLLYLGYYLPGGWLRRRVAAQPEE